MSEQKEKASPKIFWLWRKPMKKYHAFTLESGNSLCRNWFVGARALMVDWEEMEGESVKCKTCQKRLQSHD